LLPALQFGGHTWDGGEWGRCLICSYNGFVCSRILYEVAFGKAIEQSRAGGEMQHVAKNLFIAIVAVLLVPCLSFLVAEWRKEELNTAFLAAVGNKDPAKIADLKRAGISFEAFCSADVKNEHSDICSYLQTQQNYELGVYAALALGWAQYCSRSLRRSLPGEIVPS
jgi:hypothetical protein